MGKRNKVTTRDIAKAINVSQSTVSMILSDNKMYHSKKKLLNLSKKQPNKWDIKSQK